MSDLFAQLTLYLTEKQIGHWSNLEERAVCLDFPSMVGFYRVYAKIDSEDGHFHACGQARLSIPEGGGAAVVQLLELVNGQQMYGEVELDQEKSELRFRVSENLTGDELSGEMIERLINRARNGVDTYLRASLCVIFGNEEPANALRQAMPELRI